MINLFNSVLKGHSFGAIIGLEAEKNFIPLFAFREFTKDGTVSAANFSEDIINNVANFELLDAFTNRDDQLG